MPNTYETLFFAALNLLYSFSKQYISWYEKNVKALKSEGSPKTETPTDKNS